jgi:hypothetical protein
MQRRRHRSVIALAIAEGITAARECNRIGPPEPVQLDLFAEIPNAPRPRRGRPRTARVIYRGSNRRGYRRE